MQLQLTWWASAHAQERALLHVCSFYQYIYRAAALDAIVASSLPRVVAGPLRKKCTQNASRCAA